VAWYVGGTTVVVVVLAGVVVVVVVVDVVLVVVSGDVGRGIDSGPSLGVHAAPIITEMITRPNKRTCPIVPDQPPDLAAEVRVPRVVRRPGLQRGSVASRLVSDGVGISSVA